MEELCPRSFRVAASAVVRIRLSQRRAQANSIDRIPNPTGMTMKAGPGSTIRAKPASRTVKPMITMAIRLAWRKVSIKLRCRNRTGILPGGETAAAAYHNVSHPTLDQEFEIEISAKSPDFTDVIALVTPCVRAYDLYFWHTARNWTTPSAR